MYQLLFRKRWTSLLLMFLSLVIVAGCNEEDPPAIAVSQNLIEVGYERSSTLISVVTNAEWTAVSNADWCRLSRTSGRFSADVDVIIDECASDAKRSAVITLTTTGRNAATTTIMVSQSAENCSLTITPGEITVGNMGETVAFAVAASPHIEYTVSSSADWAKPAVKSGKGNGTIKVVVAENVSHSIARSAVITLSMKNDSEVLLAQFTVHQLSRRVPVIHLGQESLSFTQDAFTAKTNSYTIPVITNITGTLHVTSDFTWCKGELVDANGFKYVKISTLSNNETNEARDCVVSVVGDVDGEAVTMQVKVSQAGLGSPVVTLFREIVSVDQHVNNITVGYVPVSSGIKVEAMNDFPTWIQDVKVNASLKTITFSVKANEAEESRTGTVTLVATLGDECMVYPITVIQSGLGEAKITVTPEEITLPATITDATEYFATIIAQTRYSSVSVSIAEGEEKLDPADKNNSTTSWLTAKLVEGSSTAADAITAQVKLVATDNITNSARTATIVLTFKYGTRTIVKTFTVVQAGLGDPFITILNPAISLPYSESAGTIQYTPSSTNISVTQAVPDQTWISVVSVADNKINFTLSENKGTAARTGTINVYATRDGVTLTYPVTITQTGYGDVDIRISPATVELEAARNMTTGTGSVTSTLTIAANHDEAEILDVIGNTTWLTVNYNGYRNSYSITAQPNTTYAPREAILAVTVKWGSQTVVREIKVTQKYWGAANMSSEMIRESGLVYMDGKKIWVSGLVGGTMSLTLSDRAIIADADKDIKIKSAVADWLTYDNITGLFTVLNNDTPDATQRTATIEVTMSYGTSDGTQTTTEVYEVIQDVPLHEIIIPEKNTLDLAGAFTVNDYRITGIPAEGLSTTSIYLQAPEGAVITEIKPRTDTNDSKSLKISNVDAPGVQNATFSISADENTSSRFVLRIVDVTIESKGHDAWKRTIQIYIYQSRYYYNVD